MKKPQEKPIEIPIPILKLCALATKIPIIIPINEHIGIGIMLLIFFSTFIK